MKNVTQRPLYWLLPVWFCLPAILSATTINSGFDFNGDGAINILIIGSTNSINGGQAFAPAQIATELEDILSADPSVDLPVNVVAENIYTSKLVTLGLGGSGTEYTWNHHRHSLAQYYYWPEGQEARMDNLTGTGGTDWDYVLIGADPFM
ncbi:MAG: hypothetical protein AAF597_19855, partial [Bacteroidota bacterium]